MDCRSSLFASVTYVSNRAHAGNQADRVSPPVTWQAKKKAPLARGFPSLPGPLLAYGSEQVAVRGSQVGLRTPGSAESNVPGVTPVPAAAAPGRSQAPSVPPGRALTDTAQA